MYSLPDLVETHLVKAVKPSHSHVKFTHWHQPQQNIMYQCDISAKQNGSKLHIYLDNQVDPHMGELTSTICTPLKFLFTKSLVESTLPEDWKEAHIAPLRMKRNCRYVANYWSISLISILCSKC